jgi:hypothetical protein
VALTEDWSVVTYEIPCLNESMRLLEGAEGTSVEGITGVRAGTGSTRGLGGVDDTGTTCNSGSIPLLILLTLVFAGGGVDNTLG